MANKNLLEPGKGIGFWTSRAVLYVVLGLWALLTIAPLVFMFLSAFKGNTEFLKNPFGLPKSYGIDHYLDAWRRGDLGVGFFNSVIYVSVSTVLILLFSQMAAFALGKMRFKRISAVIYGFIGVGILISMQAILIPLFIQLSAVGLLNSRWGLIIVYVALGLPMAIYIATEYVKGIPDALIESAYMDGASNFRMFLSIVLPMTAPVTVVLLILNVLAYWNEFMMAFVLMNNPDFYSLPVGVFSFSSTTSVQYSMQFAALCIATLPILVVYFLFQKKITEGVITGAVKG